MLSNDLHSINSLCCVSLHCMYGGGFVELQKTHSLNGGGLFVGALVGDIVGAFVGALVGVFVGALVGTMGARVGANNSSVGDNG